MTIANHTKCALLLLTLSFATSAEANVFQGNIIRHPGLGGTTGSSVDHWYFTVNELEDIDPGFFIDLPYPGMGEYECCANDYPTSQRVTIDTLSWERGFVDINGDSNGESINIDVNGDGEIAFLDTYTYLFHDDGSLDASDLIASNDDSDFTFDDGSIHRYDSFLEADLAPGDYILAIGSFFLSPDDAIDRFNDGNQYPFDADGPSDHGDYQITFGGNVSVTGSFTGPTIVPEPASLLLGLLGLTLMGATSVRSRLR